VVIQCQQEGALAVLNYQGLICHICWLGIRENVPNFRLQHGGIKMGSQPGHLNMSLVKRWNVDHVSRCSNGAGSQHNYKIICSVMSKMSTSLTSLFMSSAWSMQVTFESETHLTLKIASSSNKVRIYTSSKFDLHNYPNQLLLNFVSSKFF
jgi:hypothetical protein